MDNNLTPSTSKIILKSIVIIHLPLVIILCSICIPLLYLTDLKLSPSLLIAGIVSWIYWEFSVIKWIEWALRNGVDQKRLYKIGVRSLTIWVWDNKKIEKVAKRLETKKNNS